MIAMPYDYPIIEKEYFALSTLGYWGKTWFTDLIAANEEDKKVMRTLEEEILNEYDIKR